VEKSLESVRNTEKAKSQEYGNFWQKESYPEQENAEGQETVGKEVIE
jgi:hypothetical protein